MDELATLRAPAERFDRLVREPSLTGTVETPVHRLVRLSLTAESLVATTPTSGDGPTFEVRYADSFLSSVDAPDEPVFAALGTEGTLRWLEWFDEGTLTVEVGPLPSSVVDPGLESGRPTAFGEDGTFAPDGTPAPTTVDGPECENRYGPELATLARVLSGEVTLQVVPGGPLAVVQETPDAVRRYVFEQSM